TSTTSGATFTLRPIAASPPRAASPLRVLRPPRSAVFLPRGSREGAPARARVHALRGDILRRLAQRGPLLLPALPQREAAWQPIAGEEATCRGAAHERRRGGDVLGSRHRQRDRDALGTSTNPLA